MNKSPSMTPADSAFSAAIRHRDNHCCQYCGRPADDYDPLDCAHVVGRREKILRWDADAAVTLCRAHHGLFTRNPALWDQWIVESRGEAYRASLEVRRRMVLKVNAARLKEIAAHYRAELRRMKKNGTHDLEPWVPYEAYALRAG